MKKTAAILLTILICSVRGAGQFAPDFTSTALDGQTYNLYNTLNEGKIVVLAFFSTQSPYSLTYHNSNALKFLYQSHGPSGDNRLQIFYVEGDPSTPAACLTGNCPGSNNQNWVSGIPFPIINDHNLAALFGVSTFPSVFIICPGKRMQATPPLSANSLWARAKECPVAQGVHNAGIYYFDPGTPYDEICGAVEVRPKFKLVNVGQQTITQANIAVSWNNELINTLSWNGFLGTYDEVELEGGNIALTGAGDLSVQVQIPEGDLYPEDNTRFKTFQPAKVFSDSVITVRIRTDQYGFETFWSIQCATDLSEIAHGGNEMVGLSGGGVIISPTNTSVGSYNSNSTILRNVRMPSNGCYSFTIVDAFGDGFVCDPGVPCGYRLFDVSNLQQSVISGGQFQDYKRHLFRVNAPFAVPVLSLESDHPVEEGLSVAVTPNPVSASLSIQMDLTSSAEVSIIVYSALGERMTAIAAGRMASGAHLQNLDVSNWPAGLYYMVVNTPDKSVVKAFVVQ